jgi:CHAT domain-containing protein
MRSEIIIGGEADRQKLAEEWNKLYQRMVKVCLDMENKTAALEYIERSKTRNLVELFHKSRSLPQNLQRINFQEIRSLLHEDEAILQWYITFNSFKVFIITRDSTQPNIWHSSSEDLQELENFQQEYIDDIKDDKKYDNWRNQLETRIEKLAKILHIEQIISRIPENCQRLILVPFRYLHLLPLHALTSRRVRQNVEETGSLLELFSGGVRYTPSCQLLQLSQRVNPTGEESSPTRLFAIQNPNQNTKDDLPFADIEVEAIAKSFNHAEVLIGKKASKTGLQQQIAGLQNADIAHFSCHGFFDFSNPRKSALILAGAKITPLNPPLPRGETGEDFPLARGETGEDFPLVNGETGEDFPLVNSETAEVPPLTKGGLGGVSSDKSYIRSRRGETFDIAECLTLEEIFNLSLSKCSLVTLSACETGLTDIRDNTDEYIGLPSGFFYAGATSVISTLWAVNDVSTAILMIKFYEIFLSETRPPVAIALRESQLWLKEATVQHLVDWVANCKLISDERKEEMQNSIEFGQKPENKRYQSPHFWAAFCAIGQ